MVMATNVSAAMAKTARDARPRHGQRRSRAKVRPFFHLFATNGDRDVAA